MERQSTFADAGFDKYQKKTRRAQFLEQMEVAVPWKDLVKVIEPHYPVGKGRGRPPIGIERMLRIHFLQIWFNLSDPAVEESLYDIKSMREFARIDLGREPVPDETTVCKFRHLLEENDLAQQLFETVNAYLSTQGIKVSNGTIVDASIVNAPSSTKNKDKQRDPEMHQTKKGNDWYFGMKMHIGVDSKTGVVHSVATSAANVHDSKMIGQLLHGEETRVWGDSAYTGQREKILGKAPHAQDFTHRRGVRSKPLSDIDKAKNTTKSRVRARVEHVFRVIKQQFGMTKTRYRGLKKNNDRIVTAMGLANIYTHRRKLVRQVG